MPLNACHLHTTHCNTLQNTTTHCNTLQHTSRSLQRSKKPPTLAIYTLQHATNTLQHAATRCNMLQHAATRCNTVQYSATRCNTLQHTSRALQRRKKPLTLAISHINMVKVTSPHRPCNIRPLHHTHEWVKQQMKESCHIWRSHVIHEGAMSHTIPPLYHTHAWVRPHMNESCYTWRSHLTYEKFMSHMKEPSHTPSAYYLTHMNESGHMNESKPYSLFSYKKYIIQTLVHISDMNIIFPLLVHV